MDEDQEVEYVGAVTLAYDNLDEDAEVEIFGLGVFPNNKTSQVTAEQAAAFKTIHGKDFPTEFPEVLEPMVDVDADYEPDVVEAPVSPFLAPPPVVTTTGTVETKDEV